MTDFKQYEPVRVRHLQQQPDAYDGWRVNQRPPQAGDVGVLIDILTAPGVPDRYVVEYSGPNGITIWLADFVADELEPLG